MRGDHTVAPPTVGEELSFAVAALQVRSPCILLPNLFYPRKFLSSTKQYADCACFNYAVFLSHMCTVTNGMYYNITKTIVNYIDDEPFCSLDVVLNLQHFRFCLSTIGLLFC